MAALITVGERGLAGIELAVVAGGQHLEITLGCTVHDGAQASVNEFRRCLRNGHKPRIGEISSY